jgi:protein-S-isoprenylcysteine O-methyltransferase Ste14
MSPSKPQQPPAGAPGQGPATAAEGGDHPDVVALPPLIFLLFVTAGMAIHLAHPIRVAGAGPTHAAGVMLSLVSAVLAIWAFNAMRSGGTNVRPDRPTVAIVTGGPFRFTRNPLYLSLCVLQLALGLLVNDWALLVLTAPLALALHFGVVLREEAYLEGKFGPAYLDFKRRVRRWI